MEISVVVGGITHVMYAIIRTFSIFSKIFKLLVSLLETEVKSKLPLENNTCFQSYFYKNSSVVFNIIIFLLFLYFFIFIYHKVLVCLVCYIFPIFLSFSIFMFLFLFFHFFKLPHYWIALEVLLILFLNVCKLCGTM